MKALTIWQPWASALVADRTVLGDAIRPKQYETRSWSTPYRGPLLICAAAKWDPMLAKLAATAGEDLAAWQCPHPIADGLARGWPRVAFVEPGSSEATKWVLPLGQALGVVDLVDVIPTERMQGQVPEWEWALGDYSPGRFAWRTDNLRRFAKPFPVCGRQGLFDVPDDVVAKALAP